MNLLKLPFQIVMFIVGGIGYYCIELLYRAGNSHWVMLIIGGLAFLLIMDVNYIFRKKNLFLRLTLSTIAVSLLELISGLIINKWLLMKVWDYTNCAYNFCGQICLRFSFYWTLICLVLIVLFDISRILYRKIIPYMSKSTQY